VFCYDTLSNPPVKHKMAYAGYKQARGTVRCRCPARRLHALVGVVMVVHLLFATLLAKPPGARGRCPRCG
jgi:hypothetical protein